jgi:hypothetical protein
MKHLKTLFITLLIMLSCLTEPARAFCGFYVAKADASLYNQASQVIIARDGNRTVLTMSNDYKGDVKDFALVVPVPVILEEEQVHIGEPNILERLDSFSSPRLVEYFDTDPCNPAIYSPRRSGATGDISLTEDRERRQNENTLGVTIEKQFTVGEYDILILSAKESNGLETWLRQNNYQIPRGASQVLNPYIKQNMKFFVAKVNLEEFAVTGFKSLRPLMMAFESPKYILPIRLGMLNAQGDQDLIVYLLSPKGETELTNYRTVKIASDVNIPEFVQKEFTDFYKSMFQTSYEREGKKVAFLEYAWNMASCDPCAATPLNNEELRKAGVFWLNEQPSVFITRLHVRYSRNKFPEDLHFQETGNSQFFQGRYIMQHPFKGEMNCDAAKTYKIQVRERQEKEAQTLANLTGWNINDIRKKIDFIDSNSDSDSDSWWNNIW